MKSFHGTFLHVHSIKKFQGKILQVNLIQSFPGKILKVLLINSFLGKILQLNSIKSFQGKVLQAHSGHHIAYLWNNGKLSSTSAQSHISLPELGLISFCPILTSLASAQAPYRSMYIEYFLSKEDLNVCIFDYLPWSDFLPCQEIWMVYSADWRVLGS